MKFETTVKEIGEALGKVCNVVEKKSTIPVLANILIESAGSDRVRITGTDLDTTITTVAAAAVSEEGSICLNGRKTYDIVRLLNPKKKVKFKSMPNFYASIDCESSHFKVAGADRRQYPETDVVIGEWENLSPGMISRFITFTSFAITGEQGRFTLSGAKFETTADRARMITTDGHRLVYIEEGFTAKTDAPRNPINTLIPKKALAEVHKMIRTVSGAGSEEEKKAGGEIKLSGSPMEFAEDRNHLYFKFGDLTVFCRKLTGNFPAYEAVIPKNNRLKAEISSDDLFNALNRTGLLANEQTGSITIEFNPYEAIISSESREEGAAEETLDCTYQDESRTVKIDVRLLKGFLAALRSSETPIDRLSFMMGEESDALLIEPATAQEFHLSCVIMPLRY